MSLTRLDIVDVVSQPGLGAAVKYNSSGCELNTRNPHIPYHPIHAQIPSLTTSLSRDTRSSCQVTSGLVVRYSPATWHTLAATPEANFEPGARLAIRSHS